MCLNPYPDYHISQRRLSIFFISTHRQGGAAEWLQCWACRVRDFMFKSWFGQQQPCPFFPQSLDSGLSFVCGPRVCVGTHQKNILHVTPLGMLVHSHLGSLSRCGPTLGLQSGTDTCELTDLHPPHHLPLLSPTCTGRDRFVKPSP